MVGVRVLLAVPAAAVVAAGLAGCAQGSGGGTPGTGDSPSSSASAAPSSSSLPSEPDDLVLRVDQTGGYTTPVLLASRLPEVSVYADGRVVTQGPIVTVYPPRALPNLQVQRVDPARVEAVVQQALDAGVGQDVDLGEPPLADATSTRFTVVTDAGRAQLEAYALTEASSGPDGQGVGLAGDLTQAQLDARQRLLDVRTALLDLGVEAGSASEPYAPTAVAALAAPHPGPDPDVGEQPEVPWPGPALLGEPLTGSGSPEDGGCVVATGPEAAAVLAAAGGASTITPWTSGGARWSVALRPLLPDETGCADLSALT